MITPHAVAAREAGGGFDVEDAFTRVGTVAAAGDDGERQQVGGIATTMPATANAIAGTFRNRLRLRNASVNNRSGTKVQRTPRTSPVQTPLAIDPSTRRPIWPAHQRGRNASRMK